MLSLFIETIPAEAANNEMLVKIILFAGCFFVLTLALGQLFIKRKSTANYILIIFLLICSICLFSGSFRLLGIADYFPHLNKAYLPFFCITGPIAYFYNRCIFEGYVPQRKTLLHLIPSICCFLLSIPFYLETSEFKIIYIETNLFNATTIMVYLATRIAETSLLVYLSLTLLFLRKLYLTHEEKNIDPGEIKAMLFVISLAMIAAICRPIGAVNEFWTMSMLIPVMMICLTMIALYCISHRYPRLLSLSSIQHKITRKKSGDIEQLKHYTQTIVDQKLFLDPDITVGKLAAKLNTQGRCLSELINNTTNNNFVSFIHAFRIDHAKKLLIENPELSVLQIVYASGYNSKSAFYTQFSNSMNQTPFEFRKQNHKIHNNN